MRLIITIATGLFLAAGTAGPARAQDLARFTAMDQSAVRMYFAANPIVWMGLPSELARDFARGKPLPRGTEAALPRPLLAKLPARQGYNYVRVGDDVALIDAGTRVVMDVIENVFR
jgi:hypothetical protein